MQPAETPGVLSIVLLDRPPPDHHNFRALGGKAFATFGTAFGNDSTPGDGSHTGAEAMTTFAHKVARLKSAFH